MASKTTTQTQGSDEIREMFCEECNKYLTKYVPAEGFCVECLKYKCDMCIMYHTRHFPKHQVQDKTSMPQDFCFETCSVHPDELIKFYCEDCGETACLHCKTKLHKNCGAISHLPTLVNGVEQNQDIKDILKQLEHVSNDLENTKHDLESNFKSIPLQEEYAVSKIASHRENVLSNHIKLQQEIIRNFDKTMEETINKLKKERQELTKRLAEERRRFEEHTKDEEAVVIKKVEKWKDFDQTNIETLIKRALTLTEELEQLSSELLTKQSIGLKCQLFIAMKNVRENMKHIRKTVHELKQRNKIHFYTTELRGTEFSLKTANTVALFRYEKIHASKVKKSATISSDTPLNTCSTQNALLMSGNRLIIADYDNKCIVMHNGLFKKKMSFEAIKLSSRPWALTEVADNKFAVTLPDKGVVRLITFIGSSTTVINTKDIALKMACYGIVHSNNKFIVSYASIPGKVQILDMSGAVLKSFDTDCHGKSLFSLPSHLALSADKRTVYVSDWDRHSVTSMTFGGKIKAIYKDEQLRNPSQLTVDRSGTVYVCGQWSHNVHQLSHDLTKVQILLDESYGIHRPTGIAHCWFKNRLYVGTNRKGGSSIKVFDLSLE